MTRKRFQYEIVTGKLAFPVTIFLAIALWIAVSFLMPEAITNDSYPFGQLLREFIPGNLFEKIICFLCYTAICYLLIEFNNAYSIIRVRTSLQTSLYLLMLIAFPFLLNAGRGCCVSLCVILSLYILFRCYQHPKPAGYVFHSMLFVGLSSILFPKILFLFPFFLVGVYNFKALTARTVGASIVGLILPYWFLFGYAFYHNNMEMLYTPFKELVKFQSVVFNTISTSLVVSSGVTIFILIISAIHYGITNYEDKIRVRSYINFLILLSLSIIILGIFQPQYAQVLLQILLPISALFAGHLFALTETRLSNIFFIFFILLLTTVMCYNLWIL